MANFTVGQVLTAAELNDLDERPTARVYRAAAYSDASGTVTLCPFDTVQWDTQSGFSTSTHLYTVPEEGYYHVDGSWARNTTSSPSGMQVTIYHNGSAAASGPWGTLEGFETSVQGGVVDALQCNQGDTIGLYYEDVGGGTIGTTTGVACYMTIYKVASL
jgi:hypothetical protein